MQALLSLAEAASMLGVSKATLRNWDKSKKLASVRVADNNYRMYPLAEVQKLLAARPVGKEPTTDSLFQEATESADAANGPKPQLDSKDKELRRVLARLHRALRDTDANSSIIERFDETTKLLFLRLLAERSGQSDTVFSRRTGEDKAAFATRLRKEFAAAAKSNPGVFPPKFSAIQLSDAAISAVGEILAGSDFSDASQDIKGLAYEEMIRNTFDKGDNQQFFTPAPIVEFLVAALSDRMRGAVVCDPASGTGGFLVEVLKANVSPSRVVGIEIDERLAWVTGINLFVHGAEGPQCYCYSDGGTLGSAVLEHEGNIDVIVTNPPFGSDFADQPALSHFALGRGRQSRRRGVLFIERCLELLRPGGWLGIVIDEGVLSLPSAADVRQLILQKAELVAVVSLPETAFMPYASVNTSILILRKAGKPSLSQLTFYAKAENVGRKPNGDVDITYLDDGTSKPNSDLPEILSAWRAFVKSGTIERQTDSIFLSNPMAWEAETVAADTRLDFQFHHPSRIAAQNALESCAYSLRLLGEICEVRNETYVPSVDFQDQVILYTGLAHIEAHTGHALQVPTPANSLTSGVRRYQTGDILFARMRPSLRKVALIEFAAPGFASAECVVLRVKKDKSGKAFVDPYLLAELLRSDYAYGQIIHLIAGIGRPRINLKDLLVMKIPIPPHEHQEAIRQASKSLKEKHTALRLEARRLIEAADLLEADATATVARSFLGQN